MTYDISTTCPHVRCGKDIDAKISPGFAGSYWDPPESAEIESATGCKHAEALTPKVERAIWDADQAAIEREAERGDEYDTREEYEESQL
jgi:hypothetical protein